MSTSTRPKPNLTRQDWLLAALDTAMNEGIAAISIDRLATTMGVTRGSFYHHFSDRIDLLDSLLEYWSYELTLRIRELVSSLKLDPATTLLVLLRTIRAEQAAKYDAVFRAWALSDERARAVVAKVDDARLNFIRSQFEALGFEGAELETRARLFLFYEVAAPAMFLEQNKVDSEDMLLARHRLLTTR